MGLIKDSISEATTKIRLATALQSIEGVDKVEALIGSKINSEAKLLEEISRYLLDMGGKRIRPALTLLIAKAFGMKSASPQLIDVAAGIELIHMATLLHDDIIDRSPLRRHVESPFVKYGTNNTLLAGDFLLVRAFSLCSRLDRFIIDATESACVALTEGEILEVPLRDKDHTIYSSLDIARKKTSSLFSLACRSGGHLCQLPIETVNQLGLFGENIGITFQIIDDILDVTSTEAVLGKKPGSDIKEQKPSIINVLWINSGSKLATTILTKDTEVTDNEVELGLSELRGNRVVDEAKKIAANFTHTAKKALDLAVKGSKQVDTKALSALELLVDYALERVT